MQTLAISFPIPIHLLVPIFAVFMATLVVFYRIRETKKPVTAKKIIIPPLGMSTGFFMFVYPPTRIPLSWALTSFFIGVIFLSIPLIRTSTFEQMGSKIYLKRSRAFLVILISLFIIRLILHNYIELHISLLQTGAIFFILAFGMLLPWRLTMFFQFKKLEKEISNAPPILKNENVLDQDANF
jgi:membrane protein CcdC involved in cytochrome C biogenesis